MNNDERFQKLKENELKCLTYPCIANILTYIFIME